MPTAQPNSYKVGVIGGGFTGAMFAVHLARAASVPVAIDIIEPRETVGAGLAYGSCGPEHRINVPSDRMFVFAEDRDHLSRWLKRTGRWDADRAALTPEGHHYSTRRDFAAYIAGLVSAAAEDNPSGSVIRHIRRTALRVSGGHEQWRVECDDGGAGDYAAVILCVTHAAPSFRWPITNGAEALPHLVRDPWAYDAIKAIPSDARVVVIGTGLTMSDAVITLREHGHRGTIHAIARRALTPRPHGEFYDDFDLFGSEEPPSTAIGLLRLVRRRIAEAAEVGVSWHAVIDAVRRRLIPYWASLPMPEQAKIVHRLRTFWDVHRFRMAPQVVELMERGRSQGWLRLSAGHIEEIGRDGDRFSVRWTPRGGETRAEPAEAIINCTGPDNDLRRSSNPVIRSAIANGLIRPDALRIGVDVDADGHLIDSEGCVNAGLWAAGPLARVVVGEATGVPEASAHARHVAEAIAHSLEPHAAANVSGEIA